MKTLLSPLRATFALLDGLSGGTLSEVVREITGQTTRPLPLRLQHNRTRYLVVKRRYNRWPH